MGKFEGMWVGFKRERGLVVVFLSEIGLCPDWGVGKGGFWAQLYTLEEGRGGVGGDKGLGWVRRGKGGV